MVARAQRLTVWLLLASSIAWLAGFGVRGQWALAAVGAVAILNLQALVLALEFFVLLPHANRIEDLPRPAPTDLLRAWAREVLTAHEVFSWQQPFRSMRHADTLDAAGARGRRAVVLVHGYLCNRGIWNRWVPRLNAARVPFIAVTMEPPFASIDDFVAILDNAIDRATSATGLPPLLVGHSMGGLAIRAWWHAAGVSGDARVHSVITIATPHSGTVVARFARGLNARQMRRHSDWLAALARSERSEQRARYTCFYSHVDNIALPASTARLDGADNRHIPHQPHVALAFAPEVIEEALRRLGPGSG